MTENQYVKFWIEDGILYNQFKESAILDEKVVKELIDLRHRESNNNHQYWCYDFTQVTSMPKTGRDYAEKHGQDFLYATAAVVNNPIQVFIINLFTTLKRPKVPFKAFSTKEDAVKWLNELRKQNGHL